MKALNLGFATHARHLLHNVDLHAEAGQLHAILGPNGAGKSTLLKVLAGDLAPTSGTVTLGARALDEWSCAQRAHLRAMLPQQHSLNFAFSAREVVALGRLVTGADDDVIEAALAMAGCTQLAARRYTELSGGERARVQLARTMAQIWRPTPLGARALLLDEPTANLDLAWQHHSLRAVRTFARSGVACVVVLHDPNLVLAYADQVTLLDQGRVVAQGRPRSVLTAHNLSTVYQLDVRLIEIDGAPWMTPLITP